MIYKDQYDYAVYTFKKGIPHYYGSYATRKEAEEVEQTIDSREPQREPIRPVEYYTNPSIYKRGDHYEINKTIQGKTHYLGSFTTYEEALSFYEKITINGIDGELNKEKPTKLPRYIYKTKSNKYGIHKYNGRKQEYYGSYNTLEEAVEMVEKLEKYGWNNYRTEID